MRCGLLLECHIFSVGTDFLCAATKNHLHAATAKSTFSPADALRCTAFLDVSSLNFGSAHKALPFFFVRAAVGGQTADASGHKDILMSLRPPYGAPSRPSARRC